MATLFTGWNQVQKRRLLWTGAAFLCLLGVAAVVCAQFVTSIPRTVGVSAAQMGLLSTKARPAKSETPSKGLDSAKTGYRDRHKVALSEHPSAPSLGLAPAAASRVLSGVTQLALAIPDATAVASSIRPIEDADAGILRQHFARLKAGRAQFARIPSYTATLIKQERVGSSLLEEVSFGLKIRHQPFSVFMKWQSGDDLGKEVLYVDGGNDGQLLVRLGGLKGRILPALKIDPFGSLALAQSRYPITKLGILALADTLIERRELEMREKVVLRLEQRPDADCDGRACSVYVFEDSDRRQSPVYRKSIQYIDRQWNVPLRVANYTWPEPGQHLAGPALDDATLIEYYMYSEIVTDARLTDADFDRANAEYHFHR